MDIFYRLTTYNILCIIYILLTNSLNNKWTNVIKTTSLLMAIIVAFILIRIPTYKFVAFYEKTIPSISSNILLIQLHNALIHFMPVFLLGIPNNSIYTIIGFILVYVYYLIIRQKNMIHRLYIDGVSKTFYDNAMIISGVVTSCIIILYSLN
jgi:hypothetical protein